VEKPLTTDWANGRLVERIQGKVFGARLLKGTRLPIATIIDNFDAGESPESIAELLEVPLDQILAVLSGT
jgi:uncharacterized protein (DUF433 family)